MAARAARHLKATVYDLLANPLSGARNGFDLGMSLVVVASVIALLLESSVAPHDPLAVWAQRVELVVVPLFIAEYLLRLWVASDLIADFYEQRAAGRAPLAAAARALLPKLAFMAHPLAIIDLLAILPAFRPFRLMRIFVLLRFLKILRYSGHVGQLLSAFRERSWELGMVALLFLGVLTFSSFSIFILEGEVNPQIHTLGDAFWWAIVTITTVGYGDVVAVTGAGKLLSGGVMLSGLAFLAFSTSLIASALTEKLLTLKEKKMVDAVSRLKRHYVVCGFGQVGEAVADELAAARAPFVVLDRDPERAEAAAKKGYAVYVGNAVSEEDLEAVRLEEARGLVSAMASEVDNVYTVLTAREMNPEIHIVARAASEEARKKLQRVGANRVVYPAAAGSRHMAHVLLRPTASDFVEVAMSSAGAELQLEEIPIGRDCPAAGVPINESGLRSRYHVLAVAVKRRDGTMVTAPPGNLTLQEGDVVVCIGGLDDLERLRREW